MPTKIIIQANDSENPFRPEGELAHEAEEYVRDFMYKKQQALDQSLRSTSSLDGAANQSKSVSLVLNQTVGGGVESSTLENNNQKSPNKEAAAGANNSAQSETVKSTDSKKKKKEKKNSSDKSCDNCPTKNGTSKECCKKKSCDKEADGDQKKVKSKCGCVIS